MALLILLALIILNGIFALSELAIVSASKARLQQEAEGGKPGAAVAIELADDPNRFLSTVQIGITLVGIFAGAFGGSAIAGDIAQFLIENLSVPANIAGQLGIGLIVLLTTYLSLVIGELVPKRIALSNPERFAAMIAPSMKRLSQISAPLVWFLSKSTEMVSRLLGVQGDDNKFITDFEVIAMVREGLTSGEFNAEEHEMVKGALELDDKRVREIATPRTEIAWLDINSAEEEIRQILRDTTYSAYIVAEDDIDNVIGVVRTKDLLTNIVLDNRIDLRAILKEPFYVPETAIAADVLQKFKVSEANMALVIGEYGGLEGIVTLNDIVEEVLGDLDMQDVEPIQRADGSWLIDGQYPIIDLPELLSDFDLPEDEQTDYHTIAGFVLKRLGQIPKTADIFDWGGYHIEIVDMDGQRVDKVLISTKPSDD